MGHLYEAPHHFQSQNVRHGPGCTVEHPHNLSSHWGTRARVSFGLDGREDVISSRTRSRAAGEGARPTRALLPRIVHGVGHDLLAVGCYFERKFYCLCVAFFGLVRLVGELPVVPAIKMFDDAHVRCFFFVVAHSDLEGLVHPVLIGLDVTLVPLALADYVERFPPLYATHSI